MKKSLLAISVAALAVTGCTSAMNTALPPGRMNEAGIIRPCHRDHRDAQAFGNPLFIGAGSQHLDNKTVIDQIHPGQTLTDVRAIMRHDSERRVVDGSNERWGYITSYDDKVMTWVVFTDRKVSSIEQQPWVRD